MKNLLLISSVAVLSVALAQSVWAKKSYHGGFIGPQANVEVISVEQAKNLADDTKVVLKGNIVSSLGHEHYVFRDDTGSIDIEIDKDDWHGLTVTPNDEVRIMGEVDKHWFEEPSIDVDDINVVQPVAE